MAKSKTSQSTEDALTEIEETTEVSEETLQSSESPEPAPAPEASPAPHEPAVVELQTSKDEAVKPARNPEEIAAAMHEKLSRKTDKDGIDPFVPSSQVENEVKQIANKKGFPLSRGTEIGARLMARSKRVI